MSTTVPQLRNTYRTFTQQCSIYRGGNISFLEDDSPLPNQEGPVIPRKFLLCADNSTISIVELETGQLVDTVDPGDEQLIAAFSYHNASRQLAVTTASQLIYLFKFTPLSESNEPILASSEIDGNNAQGSSKSKSEGEDDEDEILSLLPAKDDSENRFRLRCQLVRKWKGHPRPITALSFDAKGHLLASASTDRTVRVSITLVNC